MKKLKTPKTIPENISPAQLPNGGTLLASPQHLAIIIGLLTFAIYLPALQNGFVNWDDDLYVYGNLHIRALNFAFFRWAFTDLSAGFWHPITWISYAIDHAIWGMNPLGYHLTAIIIHAVNTALVVTLTTFLLEFSCDRHPESMRCSLPGKQSILITAGITGVLFGLHPLHVESVAWASERKDLLCALFFLLSASYYVTYVRGLDASPPRTFWRNRAFLMSLAMFIISLASKTMAVSLPVVYLILDRYLFDRIRSWSDFVAMMVEKLPFAVASLIISAISILAQKAIGAMPMMATTSLGQRLVVASRSIILYLLKMLVPLDLLPFYPYPKDATLLSPLYATYVLLIIAISALSLSKTTFAKALLPVWLCYLVTLLPVLGIVQVGSYSMADRFIYLPSIGPFLLAGVAVSWFWAKAGTSVLQRNCVTTFCAVVIIIMSALTVQQISIWRTSIELWSYVIKKVPTDIPAAYLNRGIAFGDMRNFDYAINDFTTAIAIDPRNVDALLNRGLAHVAMGEFEKALSDYGAALAVKPDFADAYINRGSVFLRRKEFDKAIAEYDRAVKIQPNLTVAYVNRALAHKGKGETDRAITDYSTTIQLNPDYANAYYSRAELFMSQGIIDRAAADYQKACAMGIMEGCRKALFPFPSGANR